MSAMDAIRIAGQSSAASVNNTTLTLTVRIFDTSNDQIWTTDIAGVKFDNQSVFSFLIEPTGVAYNPLYNIKVENKANSVVLYESRLDKIVMAQSQFGATIDAGDINIPVTRTLYVDNKRIDAYIEDGTILKPYKSIQAAVNSITGSAGSNRFVIHAAQGFYSEDIIWNKNYVTLVGDIYTRLEGSITISREASSTGMYTAKFSHLSVRCPMTCVLENNFLVEIENCTVNLQDDRSLSFTNVGATDDMATRNALLQISGDIFHANLNVKGLGLVAWVVPGSFGGGKAMVLDNVSEYTANGFLFENYSSLTLKNGTKGILSGCISDGPFECTLESGSILNVDASTAGFINIIEAGGTKVLRTNAGDVKNTPSGDISAVTVQGAIDELGTEKANANITPVISSGAGAPAVAPGKIGDMYIDTTAGKVYVAKGTTLADWVAVN